MKKEENSLLLSAVVSSRQCGENLVKTKTGFVVFLAHGKYFPDFPDTETFPDMKNGWMQRQCSCKPGKDLFCQGDSVLTTNYISKVCLLWEN